MIRSRPIPSRFGEMDDTSHESRASGHVKAKARARYETSEKLQESKPKWQNHVQRASGNESKKNVVVEKLVVSQKAQIKARKTCGETTTESSKTQMGMDS